MLKKCLKNIAQTWVVIMICMFRLPLLADVFQKFREKGIEIYGLDPCYFYSTPGLAWKACFKKTGVNLELLTDIDMLLVIEKGIRRRICQSTHRQEKTDNKYMKNYDNKFSHHI